MTVAAEPLETLVAQTYLDTYGPVAVLETLTVGDGGSGRAAAEEALAALWEALPGAPPGERAGMLAEVAALEARRDAEPEAAVRLIVPSATRTNGDVWAEGSVPERRDLLARALGGAPLTVLRAGQT